MIFLMTILAGVLAPAHGRNPTFAFQSGDSFATGADPGALLAVPRDSQAKRSISDLYISSYRDGRVTIAGRSEAGFAGALNAVYYDTRDFNGKRATRQTTVVDFDWGNDAPLPGFGADTFSVRWTGQFRAERTGRYRFTTESDDGVRLWINDQKIVDRWHDMAPAFHSGEIELQGGRTYKLRMDYYENGGGAVARLFWQPPGAAKRSLMRRLGGFAARTSADGGLGARALAAGDVNGDGRPDLAVANYNYDGTVTLLLSSESGGFRAVGVSSVGDDPIDLVLRDLNGDARPELIVLNRSSADLRIFRHAGRANVYGNFYASSGADVRIALPRGSGFATQLAVQDINGDGQAELLALAGRLYFVANAGGAREDLTRAFAAEPREISGGAKYVGAVKSLRATSFAAADLDRDGDPDIALALLSADGRRAYVGCLRNGGSSNNAADGAPTFAWMGSASLDDTGHTNETATEVPAVLDARLVVRARDLDGDGLADLVLNHPAIARLTVYQNQSRKAGWTPSALRLQKFPALMAPASDLRLADLNGDGKVDVAVLHGETSRASVYFAR